MPGCVHTAWQPTTMPAPPPFPLPSPSLPQIVFYALTVILVAAFVLCVFVGHNFKTGTFPWVRQNSRAGRAPTDACWLPLAGDLPRF